MKIPKNKSWEKMIRVSSPKTIASILDVPLNRVYEWENGLDAPDSSQIKKLKKLNSPLKRLRRFLLTRLTGFVEKIFISLSQHTLYPFKKTRGVITKYLASFRDDPKFLDAYSKGIALIDSDPKYYYRIHQAIWATSVAIKNEGDWVELGTGRGAVMSASLKYHKNEWNQKNKKMWLVDTFSSFEVDPLEGRQINSGKIEEDYCNDLKKLKKHFGEFNNINFVQGLVPDCLHGLEIEKIAFLHIDLNSAKAETEGLKILWDRLIKGGILLLDDYGFPNRKDQHSAMNTFALRHSVEIFQMPTGQGLVIK